MKAGANAAEAAALSDEIIVARVLSGQAELYEVLVRRHNQKLYRTVRSILRDEAETEDVMQHAYVSAYVHLDQFRGAARFSTWLVRIAVHEASARLRQGRGLRALPDATRPEEARMQTPDDPEQQTATRELGAVLEHMVEQLPPQFRTVFVLRTIEGMSTAEVATALELSEDNVKARLHRAKHALRIGVTRRLGEAAVQLWRFDAPRCDCVAARVMAHVHGLLARG